MASSAVTIRILGDASNFKRSIGETEAQLGKLDTAGKKIGGAFKAMAGGIAAAGIGAAFKGALAAAGEAQKIAAQTDAVIKSTGGAANVTAGQVDKLAGKLMRLSGVEDETIKSGQNMLLTFTNIRNGVGDGNDIFDQATRAMLDMSVAMKQDTKSSGVQLGKALNDPIKGVSALSRVGVTFTAAQKEQIKTLVASGDVMSAQKVILAELNKEFGGSAKAAGDAQTPMERLSLAFGEIQETVGAKLLPVIEKLAGWFSKHQSLIVPLAATIGGVLVAAITAAGVAWTVNTAKMAAQFAVMAAKALVSAAQVAASWLIAMGPIAVVGAAVAGLVVLVVKNWDTIKGAIGVGVDTVKGILGGLVDFFKLIPGWIGDAMKGVANLITAPYRAAFNAIAKLWNSTVGKLKFKIPGWVPGIGGKGFDVPNIPTVDKFDRGGIVPGPRGAPRLAVVHGGETVLPTHKQSMTAGGVTVNGPLIQVDGELTRGDVSALGRHIMWELGRGMSNLGGL